MKVNEVNEVHASGRLLRAAATQAANAQPRVASKFAQAGGMEPGETRWDEWDVSPEALQPLRPPEARSPIKRTVTTGRAAARAARTLLAPRARLERQRLALREAQSAARRVPQTHRHRVPTGQLNNAPSPPELGNFHESRPGPGLALPPPADGAEPNSGRQTLGGSGRYQRTVTAAASGGKRTVTAGSRRRVGEEDVFV